MMKHLNAVVIAIAVPSFFAGVGGMSELTTITGIADHRIAYPVFVLLMSCIGVAVYWIIKRVEKY
jgi:hypothetical protein